MRIIDLRLRLVIAVVAAAACLFLMGCSWFPSSPPAMPGVVPDGPTGPLSVAFWNEERIIGGIGLLLIVSSIASVIVPIFMSRPPCVRCAISCVAGWVACMAWLFVLHNAYWFIAIALIAGGFAAFTALKAHKWSLSRTLADKTPFNSDEQPTPD